MAFLCPVRIRRNKKKKDDGDDHAPQLGRITGSSSIETLVRVGLEKEAGISPDARMLVLHDFTPCVDDELEVKKGDLVSLLYRENDWAYVIDERRPLGQQNEGFIPYSYITPFLQDNNNKHSINKSKKFPRDESNSTASSNATSMVSAGSSSSEVHPFFKDPSLGRFIVLYSFTARDENDIDVQRGEFITVLNKDDPEWFWIIRDCDGQEGFVPSAFIYPLVLSLSNGGNSNTTNHHHRVNLRNGQLQQQQLQQQLLPSSELPTNNNNNPTNIHITNLIAAATALQITKAVNSRIGSNGPSVTNSMQPPSSTYYNTKAMSKQEPDLIRTTQNCAISTTVPPNTNNSNNGPTMNSTNSVSSSLPSNMQAQGPVDHSVEKAGSELIMLYDYKAQVGDDLSVRRGDWVYADLTCQPVEGWLWAYAPKQRKYGFVPKAYARPPAMTSL